LALKGHDVHSSDVRSVDCADPLPSAYQNTSVFGAAPMPWRFFHKQQDRYRPWTLRNSANLLSAEIFGIDRLIVGAQHESKSGFLGIAGAKKSTSTRGRRGNLQSSVLVHQPLSASPRFLRFDGKKPDARAFRLAFVRRNYVLRRSLIIPDWGSTRFGVNLGRNGEPCPRPVDLRRRGARRTCGSCFFAA